MHNPYHDAFVTATTLSTDFGAFRSRSKLVKMYAWAIPTEEAIEAIHKLKMPIVEIGAGSGYWAYCMRQLGIDVVAYDAEPYQNRYINGNWSEVLVGDEKAIRQHYDRALLLVWPPYNTPMASDTLSNFKGSHVVYVGESAYGCTGDDKFHTLLEKEWDVVEEVDIPQWPGIHDYLTIYRRKQPLIV